ncbi:pilus motility taxis protein HmpF [Nodularia harveyana UHCC-0300]|uniref:Pilus motility taxis protein HmpF n=1 Tax=Nodularia harveyana UHCC-0300 TaxID=2974287 RepID=A0ABU5U963_9CYAN|nr:pilus motility taxis protein HmpF [Nodularia harveyana]MEA5580064.1 pilus motility taxis protein HmpF [Nodularia harveyana UHCC-0300]
MLYLAEVQKQKGGLLSGGPKTELKLLACQRTDQNWSPVSEEAITAEDASKLNDGALVLVELNPNRQVQRIQEAGRPLVNMLQNFSRQLEKFKLKEDEIDQWKESLTFQAQEMNRREMDMEARLEQLQQMEEEFQRLESQKQDVEAKGEQISNLQAEIDRNRQELEGAWEHLRGEQRRLQELQADSQPGKVLDDEQSRVMSELLERLSHGVAPTETVREHLNLALELVETQQATLNSNWQKLEEQKTLATEQEADIIRLSQTFSDRQNTWQEAQNSLEQQKAQLAVNRVTLASKQDYVQKIKEQLQYQDLLHQQIRSLGASGDVLVMQQVDLETLEHISLEELQQIIQTLIQKLEMDSSFVQDQEQELEYKQETIETLQKKIEEAPEEEKIDLETELTDEKDLYQMLNKTLVGQRRNLLQRQKLIKQHENILLRRQGHSVDEIEEEPQIDFAPILSQIKSQQQQQSEELQKLEHEISQISTAIEIDQDMIDHQAEEQNQKQQECQEIETNLVSLQTATAESWVRVNLYQEILQPIQDSLNDLRDKLQGIANSLAEVQETGDHQLQTINEMRQTFQNLISQSELLAS